MTAKVENHCADLRTHTISIDSTERACINCIWFEPNYRSTRTNVHGYVQISTGRCLADKPKPRGALCKPCKKYETNTK